MSQRGSLDGDVTMSNARRQDKIDIGSESLPNQQQLECGCQSDQDRQCKNCSQSHQQGRCGNCGFRHTTNATSPRLDSRSSGGPTSKGAAVATNLFPEGSDVTENAPRKQDAPSNEQQAKPHDDATQRSSAQAGFGTDYNFASMNAPEGKTFVGSTMKDSLASSEVPPTTTIHHMHMPANYDMHRQQQELQHREAGASGEGDRSSSSSSSEEQATGGVGSAASDDKAKAEERRRQRHYRLHRVPADTAHQPQEASNAPSTSSGPAGAPPSITSSNEADKARAEERRKHRHYRLHRPPQQGTDFPPPPDAGSDSADPEIDSE